MAEASVSAGVPGLLNPEVEASSAGVPGLLNPEVEASETKNAPEAPPSDVSQNASDSAAGKAGDAGKAEESQIEYQWTEILFSAFQRLFLKGDLYIKARDLGSYIQEHWNDLAASKQPQPASHVIFDTVKKTLSENPKIFKRSQDSRMAGYWTLCDAEISVPSETPSEQRETRRTSTRTPHKADVHDEPPSSSPKTPRTATVTWLTAVQQAVKELTTGVAKSIWVSKLALDEHIESNWERITGGKDKAKTWDRIIGDTLSRNPAVFVNFQSPSKAADKGLWTLADLSKAKSGTASALPPPPTPSSSYKSPAAKEHTPKTTSSSKSKKSKGKTPGPVKSISKKKSTPKSKLAENTKLNNNKKTTAVSKSPAGSSSKKRGRAEEDTADKRSHKKARADGHSNSKRDSSDVATRNSRKKGSVRCVKCSIVHGVENIESQALKKVELYAPSRSAPHIPDPYPQSLATFRGALEKVFPELRTAEYVVQYRDKDNDLVELSDSDNWVDFCRTVERVVIRVTGVRDAAGGEPLLVTAVDVSEVDPDPVGAGGLTGWAELMDTVKSDAAALPVDATEHAPTASDETPQTEPTTTEFAPALKADASAVAADEAIVPVEEPAQDVIVTVEKAAPEAAPPAAEEPRADEASGPPADADAAPSAEEPKADEAAGPPADADAAPSAEGTTELLLATTTEVKVDAATTDVKKSGDAATTHVNDKTTTPAPTSS